MTTTSTAAFNPDMTIIVEEAFERCGKELRTGYDFRTARRSLNFLITDWANRGINMWTIEQGTINLVQGQNTYALSDDTVDLLEHVIRTDANQQATQADLTITRISVSTYATLPNKLQQARPIQVWIQRLTGQISAATTLAADINDTDTTITVASAAGLPAAGFIKIDSELINYGYIVGNTLYNCFRGQENTTAAPHLNGATVYWAQLPAISVWPTPDGSQPYQFVYWRMRRMYDAGTGSNSFDIPFRFQNCLVAGLAYMLSMKLPDVTPERIAMLKAQYDEAWELAANEDHEKAALRLVPRQQFIGSTF